MGFSLLKPKRGFFQGGKPDLKIPFLKRGQATVEYLLLAVVVITIGKAVVSPMGKNLQEWASKMLGPNGYYACLMEHGLIPGKAWKEHGIDCKAHKVSARGDLKNIGGGGGSGGGSGGSSSTDGGGDDSAGSDGASGEDEGEKDSEKKGRKKRGPSASDTGDGSGSEGFSEGSGDEGAVGDSSRFPFAKAGKKSQKTRMSARRKARKKARKKGGMKDVKLKEAADSRSGGPEGETGRGYLGRLPADFEEDESDGPPPIFQSQAGAGKKQGDEGASMKKKNRMQVKTLPSGKQGEIGDLEPISFGKYMKWLLIAVMLIAVILVIGSQILEFQNADT